MEVGVELIGIVKTNTKGFLNETIENLTKDFTGGYYLVLRSNPMVPRGMILIAIEYKYNTHNIHYFMVTDNSGITQAGLPYISKYPDQFYNVAILPVSHPLVIPKFIGVGNEFDSHNQSMESVFALEKLWVNKCGCLSLFVTIDMVMITTNFWKLLCYMVHRDHYDKFICIR